MEREALKMALEELADRFSEGWHEGIKIDASDIMLLSEAAQALAQPAQEPWRESASDYERGVIDGRQKQAQSSVDKAVNRMAQRTWVGLTDGVMCDIAIDHGLMSIDWIDFARAIEAKLKERNA
jgi:hypothetical protein